MEPEEDRISTDYVVLRINGEAPAEALEALADGGFLFVVMPRASVSEEQIPVAMPALELPGGLGFELPTGQVTIRWSGSSADIAPALAELGARLVRDYGTGGIVAPEAPTDPFGLAAKLREVGPVTSARVHTLRPTAKR